MARQRKRDRVFCPSIRKKRVICPSCDKGFSSAFATSENPNPKEIEEEIRKFDTEGRVRECFCCNHKVVVCKNCVRQEDAVVICACCLIG